MSIILLCSGGLGAVVLSQVYKTGQLQFVFTDKRSTSIIEYCRQEGIAFYAGNPRNLKAKETIRKLQCDVILSINYLFIVEEDMLSVAKKYAINFHGSLLPKYRGRTPHVWAIINGEKETGITAHLMTTGVDDGPVVKQIRIAIAKNDTGSIVLEKFNKLYPEIIDDILTDIKNNRIVLVEQNHSKATYFGKRTPVDGWIDWNWQKEQIRNWVRAQAEPYPGAYTFYNDEKVIINCVEYSDYGFHYSDQNGLILQTAPELIVKVSNGALRLVNFKTENVTEYQTGKILSCPTLQLTKEK